MGSGLATDFSDICAKQRGSLSPCPEFAPKVCLALVLSAQVASPPLYNMPKGESTGIQEFSPYGPMATSTSPETCFFRGSKSTDASCSPSTGPLASDGEAAQAAVKCGCTPGEQLSRHRGLPRSRPTGDMGKVEAKVRSKGPQHPYPARLPPGTRGLGPQLRLVRQVFSFLPHG